MSQYRAAWQRTTVVVGVVIGGLMVEYVFSLLLTLTNGRVAGWVYPAFAGILVVVLASGAPALAVGKLRVTWSERESRTVVRSYLAAGLIGLIVLPFFLRADVGARLAAVLVVVGVSQLIPALSSHPRPSVTTIIAAVAGASVMAGIAPLDQGLAIAVVATGVYASSAELSAKALDSRLQPILDGNHSASL